MYYCGIRKHPDPYTGFFYASILPRLSSLITKNPSHIENLKNEFFFVKGDSEAFFGVDSPDYIVRKWFKRNHME